MGYVSSLEKDVVFIPMSEHSTDATKRLTEKPSEVTQCLSDFWTNFGAGTVASATTWISYLYPPLLSLWATPSQMFLSVFTGFCTRDY